MVKVLVTDSTYKNSLAAARSLRLEGHEVYSVGSAFSMTAFSQSTSSNLRISRGESFSENLVRIVESRAIDVILPIGAKSVFEVSDARESLEKVCNFAIPPIEALTVARNKFDLQEFASSLGLEVPESWRFSDFEAFKNSLPDLPLPLVVKSTSHLSKLSPIYLRTHLDITEARFSDMVVPYFLSGEIEVQRYISGIGEGFFALYQHGECKRLMMHRRIAETPPTGGSSWAARSIYKEDLKEASLFLLDTLNWHGPAMVEFKRSPTDDTIQLIELNPKFWGSLDLTIESGFDVPVECVKVALGKEVEQNFNYRTNVVFWWPLDSWSSLIGIKNLENSKVKTNIKFSDPLPSLFAFLSLFLRTIRELLQKAGVLSLLYWLKSYGPKITISRFVGQNLGLPLKRACQITDFLWIGARPSSVGTLYLSKIRRRKIISLLGFQKSGRVNGFGPKTGVFHLPEHLPVDPLQLQEIAEFLISLETQGEAVYLHCSEGVGRAPLVASAFLMRKGFPLEQAIQIVQEARTVSRINDAQLDSLKKYELQLLSK